MKPVLIVIDMQNGFLWSKSAHIIEPIKHLIVQWKDDIVFTRFLNQPKGQYETLIGWKRLQTSPEIDLHESIKSLAKIVIDKHYYSSLTPEFLKLAEQNTWDTYFICGVATDSCVLKTAADIFEHGWRPIVISDACASHAWEELHHVGLLLLGRLIGKAQLQTIKEVFNWI